MEEQIVTLLGQDREEGLHQLQAHYGNLVRYLVRGVLRSPEDVEECVSDVYLQVWAKFDQYDPAKGQLSTWPIPLPPPRKRCCVRSVPNGSGMPSPPWTSRTASSFTGNITTSNPPLRSPQSAACRSGRWRAACTVCGKNCAAR